MRSIVVVAVPDDDVVALEGLKVAPDGPVKDTDRPGAGVPVLVLTVAVALVAPSATMRIPDVVSVTVEPDAAKAGDAATIDTAGIDHAAAESTVRREGPASDSVAGG